MQLDNGGGWHQSRAIATSPLWERATGIWLACLGKAVMTTFHFNLQHLLQQLQCSVVSYQGTRCEATWTVSICSMAELFGIQKETISPFCSLLHRESEVSGTLSGPVAI
jgi:hypothetical protein